MKSIPSLLTLCLLAIGFSFAAAGPARAADLAIIPGPVHVDLDVNAKCVGRDAEFSVVNKGGRWPSTATVRIERVSDHSTITSRRMRMVGGQRLSFKISSKFNPGDSVGLFIDPQWYERPFKYDAEIICR